MMNSTLWTCSNNDVNVAFCDVRSCCSLSVAGHPLATVDVGIIVSWHNGTSSDTVQAWSKGVLDGTCQCSLTVVNLFSYDICTYKPYWLSSFHECTSGPTVTYDEKHRVFKYVYKPISIL